MDRGHVGMANKDAIRDPKGEEVENGPQAKLTKDMKLYSQKMLQTRNRFNAKETSRYLIAKLLKTNEKETAFKQLQGEVQMPSKSNNATTADILPETMEAQRLGMTT